jgi:cation-transporting ATPase E
VGRVLRFSFPAGIVVSLATFAAYWLARSRHLALVEQRTAATLVALMLSLCVLTILALPLTWRKAVLVGFMIAGFVLLFPFAVVRKFYALQLPSGLLPETILIGVAGSVTLIATTVLLRRLGHGPATAPQAGVVTRGSPNEC